MCVCVCVCELDKKRLSSVSLVVKSFCLVYLDVQVAVSLCLPLFPWLSVHHSDGGFFHRCYVCLLNTGRLKDRKRKEMRTEFTDSLVACFVLV